MVAFMNRRSFVACLGTLPLLNLGCGWVKAEFARSNAIHSELDRYVIPEPLDEVWKQTTLVKSDRPGPNDFWKLFQYAWQDDGRGLRHTSRHSEEDKAGTTSTTTVTWFECEGREAPGGCQVRYFENEEKISHSSSGMGDSQSKSRDRRNDLELALIDVFDPPGAARIRAAGEKAAQSGEWYPPPSTSGAPASTAPR